MRWRSAHLIWIAVAAAGCASTSGGEIGQLRQKIDEMAQKHASSEKRIEDLNNRIFLLEDKVDTSKVAMERLGPAPSLPVIRIKPPEAAEAAGSYDDDSSDEGTGDDPPRRRHGGSTVVEDRAVALSGQATKTGGTRPILRLYGSASSSGGSTSPSRSSGRVQAPLPGPDPAAVTDRLAVVPMPRRRLARAMARSSVVPMRDYNDALSQYRSGKYTAAAAAFRTFVGRYNKHAYADNAMYWLGECFYDMKNFRLALKMFRQVVENYPSGNKAPDALLKMAFSYIKLKETANARTVLAQVVQSFPKSQVANLASKTLVKIQ